MKFLYVDDSSLADSIPYAERFKMFNTYPSALEHAMSFGYRTYFLSTPPAEGVASIYCCGTINIKIIGMKDPED